MKKDEKYIIDNAIKVADEFVEIMRDGDLDNTMDEYPGVVDYINNSKYSTNLLGKLLNKQSYSIENSDKESNINQLLVSLKNEKRKKTFRKRLSYISISVASAIIVVSFSIYNVLDTTPKQETPMVSQITFDKPTLILSSGENLDLTTIGEKIISEDFVAKNSSNNQLSYENNSASSKEKVVYNTIVVPAEYSYNVTLEDGTEVFLNAKSELRYPVKFKGSQRKVFLKGEGYFKVTKNKNPFIVETNDVSVKVYGTKFNVNTNLLNSVEVLLQEGSVGVSSKIESKEMMMIPNQLFLFDRISGESTIEEVEQEQYLSWMKDQFKSDNEELEHLLHRIALWYNIEFEYRNSDVKNIPMTVTLNRKSDVDSILGALGIMTDAKFIKINSQKYVIE